METLGRAGLGRWNPQDIWSHKSTHTGWLGENGRVANIIGWGLQMRTSFGLEVKILYSSELFAGVRKDVKSGKCGRWRSLAAASIMAGPGRSPPPMTGARPRGVPRCRGAARARILLDPGVHWRPDLVGPTGQ